MIIRMKKMTLDLRITTMSKNKKAILPSDIPEKSSKNYHPNKKLNKLLVALEIAAKLEKKPFRFSRKEKKKFISNLVESCSRRN